jgi:kynureninase
VSYDIRNDELLSFRGEFPILERSVYMISHSLGAMPRRVKERLETYADTWATLGIKAWSEGGWWQAPVSVGDTLGGIVGAPPGSIVMHQNVSVAESVVLSAFDFSGRRNKIVYSALNFPSVMYVHEARVRDGARIVTVPSDDGITVSTERMLEAIDEETLLVPISHVLFKSAYLQDAAAITRRAAEVGAHVILDCYQSAGTVPLSLQELGVSFAVGGSVKWLCGGPGSGWLYVRPDLVDRFEPRVTGWAAHTEPFAFEPGAIRYATGIRRWLHGTPAVVAIQASSASYELIAEVGVERIRAKSKVLTARLVEQALERGWTVNAPRDPEKRGGAVAIDVPHGLAVAQELGRRDFLVDYRPGAGIRIAPHFYTKVEECDATLAEIASILETKAYERHLGAKTGRY